MTLLGKIKLGFKEFRFEKTEQSIRTGKFMDDAKSVFHATIRDTKTNRLIPFKHNRLARWTLNTTAKGLNLVRTPGFGTFAGIMTLGMLGTGVIGYLLGRSGDEEKVAPEPPIENENKPPVAIVEETVENDFVPISTAGTSWAEIVKNYYPELVESCNGQLYGKDGAIRKLKLELSKCEDIDLVNSSDIPRKLNLPSEIDGVKINKDAILAKADNIVPGGHTDIEEAGCKNSRKVYTLSDTINKQHYSSDNLNTALDSLKNRTKVKEYQLDYAS